MNNKTAFGTVIATCDNCQRLIYEGDTHYYARYWKGEFCLCEQCVTVVNPEPLNINRTYNQTAEEITNIKHVEVFNG
jgi:hypothetical protein